MTKLVESFLKDFLKRKSISDVQQLVFGELPDVSTDKATYWYGNGEVICSPADEKIPDINFEVVQIGSNYYLSEV